MKTKGAAKCYWRIRDISLVDCVELSGGEIKFYVKVIKFLKLYSEMI